MERVPHVPKKSLNGVRRSQGKGEIALRIPFFAANRKCYNGTTTREEGFPMKKTPIVLLSVFFLVSLAFWTGCATPKGGIDISLRLLEPSLEATGVDLVPLFQWEVQFSGAKPRNDFLYTLHVAPRSQAFGEGITLRQETAYWPDPLVAGGEFHWMVELSLEGQATVCSDEGFFSTREYYVVQVQVDQGSGGQIRVNEGPWGDSFTLDAPAQQQVLLEARSQPAFVFDGWYAGERYLGNDNPMAYTPSYASAMRNSESDLQVQARFEPEQLVLTVQASPSEHGQVRIGEGEWGERESLELDAGQNALLQAQPFEGFRFVGWFLENEATSRVLFLDDQNPLVFEPVDSCEILASFVPVTYTVTLESSPSVGGNVRINGGQWGRQWVEDFPLGANVEARALAASGYTFDGWFEDGQRVGQGASLGWTVQGERSLVASFSIPPQPPVVQPPTQQWVFHVEAAFSSSPAVGSDGTIYIGANDNHLYAINPDGTQKWAFPTGGQVQSSPALRSDGCIIVGSYDHNVYLVNPNGTENSRVEAGSPIPYSPVIGADGTVFCHTFSAQGFVFANQSGTSKWEKNLGCYVCSEPTANGSYLFVPADDQKLHALDLSSGEESWAFNESSIMRGSPAIASDGTVYIGTSSRLYALDPTQNPTQVGDEKWKFPAEVLPGKNFSYTKPVIAPDGTIYAPASDGLYAIHPDGSLKWQLSSSMINTAPLVGNDGTVYAVFQNGMLYALEPQDGSEKWSLDLLSFVGSSPAMGPDGTLYIATLNGDLFAFSSYSTALANSSWPKFQKDAANSGRK